MPYIPQDARPKHQSAIDNTVKKLVALTDENDVGGNMNYIISSICNRWLKESGGTRYYKIEKLIGCLECIKLELYRRVAAEYEDKAIDKNGDI